MKKIVGIALILAAAVCLVSCRSGVKTDKNATAEEIGNKTYIWEKEGFGGRFAIVLYDDGKCERAGGAVPERRR